MRKSTRQVSILTSQFSPQNRSQFSIQKGSQFKMKDNILYTKSMAFAIRCVNLYKHLTTEKKEFVLSKQLLRSGTSIGANIRESRNAQSPADFINKLSIALKEADETQYWFELLHHTDFITDEEFTSINADVDELISILTSVIKKAKTKLTMNINQGLGVEK